MEGGRTGRGAAKNGVTEKKAAQERGVCVREAKRTACTFFSFHFILFESASRIVGAPRTRVCIAKLRR